MVDHDQRFKELLREFVWELLALFLPWLAQRGVREEMVWQSQEVFTNPPLGLVRRVDLLALLAEVVEGKKGERLLHLEVESAGSLTEVRKKVGFYYPFLRTQRNLPVTCLALYLYVGLEGEGWDHYRENQSPPVEPGVEVELYGVHWRYVGLPALPAERYLAGDNWLGVALSALMRIEKERKPWLRAEALRRLATECQENNYRKLLLLNCVETYLPMEGEQEQAYLRLITTDPRYQEANKMILTTYDRGRAEGRLETLREMVVRLARRGCGAADEATLARLAQIDDVARLEALVEAAPTATSWDQLLGSN